MDSIYTFKRKPVERGSVIVSDAKPNIQEVLHMNKKYLLKEMGKSNIIKFSESLRKWEGNQLYGTLYRRTGGKDGGECMCMMGAGIREKSEEYTCKPQIIDSMAESSSLSGVMSYMAQRTGTEFYRDSSERNTEYFKKSARKLGFSYGNGFLYPGSKKLENDTPEGKVAYTLASRSFDNWIMDQNDNYKVSFTAMADALDKTFRPKFFKAMQEAKSA